MNKFVSDALAFSEENQLFKRGDAIVIALSGGADSVALLSFFKEIEDIYSLKLLAFHLNHNLRGDEAIRDMEFSREISKKLEIPFETASVDIKKVAKERKIGTEEAGREVRYEYLSKFDTDKIATAHNKNDLAETFFINLLRGSATAGLASIPPMRGSIIRPLLCKSREEIEKYLGERGISFVNDSSNDSDIYFRNRIRNRIMPQFLELQADYLEKISKTTSAVAEDESYLTAISKKLIVDNKIEIEKLNSQPAPIAKRAVRELLKANGLSFDRKRIDLILSCVKNGVGAVNISGDSYCEIYNKKLFVTKMKEKNNNFLIVNDFSDIVFSNKQVKFIETSKKDIDNKLLRYAISCDKINGALSVRMRKNGDTFEYPNRKGSKTLKKLFNELKIPKWERDEIIIIADDLGVLWIEGIGTAKRGYGGDKLIKVEIIGENKNG